MPGDNLNTSAGSLHPGRPVIWPTGKAQKQAQQVQQTQTTQTTGGVRNVSTSKSTSEASQTSAASSAQAQSAQESQASMARAITVEDVRAHLLNQQIPDTEANMHLASSMLRSGVELSRSNFVKLFTMMQGTDMGLNTQDAAIALLMKGIDSPEALKILSNHFSQNPQMATQILNMQESIGNLLNAFQLGQGTDPGIAAALNALLSQFDDLLKGLPGSYEFSENSSVSRESLMNDTRALMSLLEGVENQASTTATAGAAGGVLSSNLKDSINKLDQMLRNLVSQAIMSKHSDRSEVNYQYYQIPNSLATPPLNMEIIIKRDGLGKDSVIDPENNQIIMSMETRNMGKLTIVMRVKEKKIGFLINTQNEEARNLIIRESGGLKSNLLDKNYITEGFHVGVNPTMCNIRPYLIPLIGIEDLLRINVEA